ncbi:MAG: nuclear transport factor 2 family protein [Halioglobus sp.]|nr:nuclear transport factor 2 family protein [Halioglobus sp.]
MTESLKITHHRFAIQDVLNRYARACDSRDWTLFDDVFTADVSVDYGGVYKLTGRDKVVEMASSMLDGCGPTQHLLGNFDIAVHDDQACCACYVRAVHAGLGTEAEHYYEVWAEYRDALQLTGDGWRIFERNMVIHKEVGSRDILRPA